MGLIKAIKDSVGGNLQDQYKEFFYCDSLSEENLVVKAKRRSTSRGSNNPNDNVITEGSLMSVNPGQAMVVLNNGKIIDYTAEPGEYTWDDTTSPSFFEGKFLASMKENLLDMASRIASGGEPARDQRIYYINTKEIFGNKFGSQQPMPYNDPLYRSIYIRYFGEYSFQIVDPLLFFHNISGNVRDVYTKEALISLCDSEFYSALDSALNQCGNGGENFKFSELPRKQYEIAKIMDDILDESWKRRRGIEIVTVGINKVTPDEKSQAKIEKRDEQLFEIDNATLYGSSDAALRGLQAQAGAEALVGAAKNESGVLEGGINLGVIQGLGGGRNSGGIIGGIVGTPEPVNQKTEAVFSWTCECGQVNTGKFCGNCGKAKPETAGKRYCSECGQEVTGLKFCPNCGKKVD